MEGSAAKGIRKRRVLHKDVKDLSSPEDAYKELTAKKNKKNASENDAIKSTHSSSTTSQNMISKQNSHVEQDPGRRQRKLVNYNEDYSSDCSYNNDNSTWATVRQRSISCSSKSSGVASLIDESSFSSSDSNNEESESVKLKRRNKELKKRVKDLERRVECLQKENSTVETQLALKDKMIQAFEKQVVELKQEASRNTKKDVDAIDSMKESSAEKMTCSPNGIVVPSKGKGRIQGGLCCLKCGVTCGTRKIFYAHGSLPTCPETFDCSECPMKFSSKNNLKAHKNGFHGGDRICDLCNLSFNNYSLYKTHKLKYHRTSAFQCSACPKCFTDQKKLNTHMKKHNKNKTKPQPKPLTEEDKKMFDEEFRRLYAAEKILEHKFITPAMIFDVEEDGIVLRKMDSSKYKVPIFLFHASYTKETQIEDGRGHFITTDSLNPFRWYERQLQYARNKTMDIGFCRHTRDCTLQGQVTDWNTVQLVCAASGEPVIKTIKYFANRKCQVSNIIEGVDKKWTTGCKENLMEILQEKQIPLK